MSSAHDTPAGGDRPIRIGTRGSPLALAQAGEARDRLAAAHPALPPSEIVVIKTTGDRVLDRPLADIGGKGLFTKEIDAALLDGRIDVAVHSMKDVPTALPDGTDIDCLLPREDPRDALFATGAARLADLAPGTRVGTASLRRQALVLLARPDLTVVSLRGTVQTRMAKLAAGEVGATLLAMAGLRRLGLADRPDGVLDPAEMLPAVAQGAIGIARRSGDDRMAALLAPLTCGDTATRVAAERACLAELDGSCRTPIAAFAELDGAGGLTLRALIAKPDGSHSLACARRGPAGDAVALGRDAGAELRRRAGPDYLAPVA